MPILSRLAAAVAVAAITLAAATVAPAAGAPAPPDRADLFRYAAKAAEGTWRKLDGPDPRLSSRELFCAALAWCEADMHADRLPRLLETAARMQDRDPASRGFGNFRWYWENPGVMDYNAVEFAMQAGTLLWLRHRDRLPQDARKTLAETLDFAVQGCLRHRVNVAYTNIALMNAQNLIMLGEALDRKDAADEGYRRLDAFVLHTWTNGISEYGSPTYYGVDLDCLGLIEAFCRRERGRDQARALLELFWTDIAANFFPPSARLAGPHSRDYNYLLGNGSVLDTHLWMAGWLPGDVRGGTGVLWPALSRWQPPAALLASSRRDFPRTVRQAWNAGTLQSRTHHLLADVALGSAASNYHNMDLPLTVDLPGDAKSPRGYFIPDARHDPYGKAKIAEGRGPHAKTLHLRPFWTAAQAAGDAVGLVLYRDEEQTATATTLESHFVLPSAVDGFWVGETRVDLAAARQTGAGAAGAPVTEIPVPPGAALVLRKGTAAVGIRVPWVSGVKGFAPTVALVDDGNPYGVVRLTVTHYRGEKPPETVVGAGAAVWVRVAGGLETDEAFDAWRRAFARADAACGVESGRVRLSAAGGTAHLAIDAGYPDGADAAVSPAPTRGVLEVNGDDVGRRLIEAVEPVKSYVAFLRSTPARVLAPNTPLAMEAESAYLVPAMEAAHDAAASGGRFAWSPGEPGGRGGGSGAMLWIIDVKRPAEYVMWGRVRSPTPEDDSFFVAAEAGGKPLFAPIAWHLGVHPEWTWVRLAAPDSKDAARLALPAGKVRLEVRAREDGAQLDRLFLSADADARPQ
jgi:hypothetical protein